MHLIVKKTKELVRREKELLAQILRNLQEIQDRKIHIEMGYPSLFLFCVEELGYSESQAYRKCQTVKMSNLIEALPAKLESGEISEQKIVQVARFVQQEKKFAQRSVSPLEIKNIVEKVVQTKSRTEVESFLSDQSQVVSKPVEDKQQVLSGGNIHFQFQMDSTCHELYEQIREFRSHHNGSQVSGRENFNELLTSVFKDYLKRNHPAHKDQAKTKVKVQESLFERSGRDGAEKIGKQLSRGSWNSMPSRYIPESVKREVARRDGWACTFENPISGKRCNSTYRLQYEHRLAHGLGGGASAENITLHCQAHNLYQAEQLRLI